MAIVKEELTIECRGLEEYYQATKKYEKDGYKLEESKDKNCLTFKARRISPRWV